LPRLLGIDYGLRRVGIALTDVEGTTAFGYTTLDAKKGRLLEEIGRIVDEEMVKGFVLGLPLRTDTGEPGEMAKAVLEFAEGLRKRFPRLPVAFEDERFSSFAAESSLKAGGWVPGKDNKAEVDKAAARILLQDYLDRMREEERQAALPPEQDGYSP
jgi:putative Holliday junction resolvase